jgi:hypothetical protein
MGLEIMGQDDSGVWDSVIDSSINGTIYHSWDWLNIIEKHSDTRLFPLVYFDTKGNKPFGAIPLFYKKRLGIKMVFSPPPGSAVRLGPVMVDKGYRQHKLELSYLDFQEQIDKFIKSLRPNYTLIISNPGLMDVRPFSWSDYNVSPLYTYMLDLSQGEEIIWSNLSESLKRQIKQSQKSEISIIENRESSGIDFICESMQKRLTEQNINSQLNKSYWNDIFNTFGGSGVKIFTVMHSENIIAAALYTSYRDVLVKLIGGARSTYQDFENSQLLLSWDVIVKAVHDGYKWYEDEGANTRHLCNLKSKYCPKPSIYFQMKRADIWGSCTEKSYRILKNKK